MYNVIFESWGIFGVVFVRQWNLIYSLQLSSNTLSSVAPIN